MKVGALNSLRPFSLSFTRSTSGSERRTRRQKRADAPLLETDSGECKIVPLRCLYLCGIRESVCVCVCVCVCATLSSSLHVALARHFVRDLEKY